MARKKKSPTKAAPWERMEQGVTITSPEALAALDGIAENYGVTVEEITDLAHVDETWLNGKYRCGVRYMSDEGRDGAVHLSIHSHNRKPLRDWRHFQQIKNDVMGPEREACELYPAESRLVDAANEYHLWVSAKGATLPVGFEEGFVSYDAPALPGRQRPEMEIAEPEVIEAERDEHGRLKVDVPTGETPEEKRAYHRRRAELERGRKARTPKPCGTLAAAARHKRASYQELKDCDVCYPVYLAEQKASHIARKRAK